MLTGWIQAGVFMGMLTVAPVLAQVVSSPPNSPPQNLQPTIAKVVGQVNGVVVVDLSKTRLVAETVVQMTQQTDESGQTQQRPVHRVVYRSVPFGHHLAFHIKRTRFSDPSGGPISHEEVADAMTDGTAVVICHTPTLPENWQEVLKKDTIVIYTGRQGSNAPPVPALFPTTEFSTSPIGVTTY